MSFQTDVNAKLLINGEAFTIGEHPYAPGVPYGQEGRQGTVYLLHSEERQQKKALKVFRSKLINPSTVHLSSQINKFSTMEGLTACERQTITPHNNPALLAAEPDLLYAVIMTWIDGPTWMDMVLNKKQLTRRQSYTAAFALAEILVTMEQRGLAHCDLSGPNLILPMFSEGRNQVKSSNFVQLIDLEQMFSIQFERPEYLPTGSPGYAPKYADMQMWNAQSDRFSGAVLLMEMLASCTSVLVEHAWGESYFEPSEMQTLCDRYDRLLQAIKPVWGDGIVGLIQAAWESDELGQCPTFGQWLMELSRIDQSVLREEATVSMGKRVDTSPNSEAPSGRQSLKSTVARTEPNNHIPSEPMQTELNDQMRYNRLMQKARDYESKGNLVKAMETYRSMKALKLHASVIKEIDVASEMLQQQLDDRKRNKSKRVYGPFIKKLTHSLAIAVVIAGIGIGGYYLFNYFKGLAEQGPQPNKAQLQITNEEVRLLKEELADRDKKIAELSEQVEELRKPMSQRSQELLQQLSADYAEIQRLAELDPNATLDVHQQLFEATETYILHSKKYFRTAYNLDAAVVDQMSIVEGYYFPFIYNHNRNAQLNYKFLNDYREKFLKVEDLL